MNPLMRRNGDLDPTTAEKLLSGGLAPEDAPPGFEAVSRAVADARASLHAVASDPAPGLLTAMAAQTRATQPIATPRRSVNPIVIAKAAGAFVGALTLTTGLAAADVLPAPVSSTVDSVTQTVGVDLPGAEERAAEKAARKAAHDARKAAAEAERDAAKAIRDAARAEREAERQSGEPTVHPDNHGAEVSDAARDKSGEGDHGTNVSKVARDNAGQDNRPATTTTVAGATTAADDDDDAEGDADDHGGADSSGRGDSGGRDNAGSDRSDTAKSKG